MKSYERLLQYIKFRTPSDENSESIPSSQCQFALAEYLVNELHGLGVNDAICDEHCYVYGHIPASDGYEKSTAIGFIAHMDTVSDYCNHDVNPQIIKHYDGGDVVLGTSGLVLSPELFPHLLSLRGRTLLTTDGTTILGGDDKAGIAEIMTAIENLKEIPHGPISIAFTPDEEIGTGAQHFDVEKFNAKYAYTLDGDTEGEIQFETFNAAKVKIYFKGENVHPGSAKNIMINASLVAMEFNSMLPACERPEHTEDYEGFYHLTSMSGSVSDAELNYIIRDHDARRFDFRQQTMQHVAKLLNEKYGDGTVTLNIKQQYRNMAEVIEQCPEVIEKARAACAAVGLEPISVPVRGGTDGSQLSYMGLPCPNLGTGGHAYHGPYEHTTFEGMDKSVELILALIKEYI